MILIAGGSGQVGRWLAELGGPRVRGLSSKELDVTDADAAFSVLSDARPEWIINCAAHTAVDVAEEEPERAAAINADGAANLAQAAAAVGARFVQISTDYVFGESQVRGRPLEADHPRAPMSVYGRTKLRGEERVREACPEATIVRTAWVYTGPHRTRFGLQGNDFVTTMLSMESSHETISVVDDQVGSPTFAHDLAAGILELVNAGSGAGETLHAAGGGHASWCDVARAVFAEVGADPMRVQPCSTEEFPRPASRPAFSVLSSSSWTRARLTPLRDWREALSAAIAMC